MRATWPLYLARLCARRMKPRSSDAATQSSWSPLGHPPQRCVSAEIGRGRIRRRPSGSARLLILVSGAPAHHIFRRLTMPAAPRRGATLSAGRDGIAASWLRAVARLVFRLRAIFRPLGYAEAPGPTGASARLLAQRHNHVTARELLRFRAEAAKQPKGFAHVAFPGLPRASFPANTYPGGGSVPR